MRRTLLVGLVMLGCGAEGPSGPTGGDATTQQDAAIPDAPYSEFIMGRVCQNTTFPMYDCDGNASNGCEVRGDNDRNNCGRCGRRCSGETPVCIGGVCTTGG